MYIEYEAEAWEMGSRHSDETGYESKYSKSRSRLGGDPSQLGYESPNAYHQASQAGDFYRDTNMTHNNSSNPNLRLPPLSSQHSHSNISTHRSGPVPTGPQPTSQYGGGMPQLPLMPFGGATPSVTGGSDYGGANNMPMMPPLGYQNTGSMYGMPMGMNMGMMGTGSVHGSQFNGMQVPLPSSMNALGGMGQRPMSTFSFATSVNPFATPNMTENPTDEELFQALRNYLSTQDLMTVTKKCDFLLLCAELYVLMIFFFLIGVLVKRWRYDFPRQNFLPEKTF